MYTSSDSPGNNSVSMFRQNYFGKTNQTQVKPELGFTLQPVYIRVHEWHFVFSNLLLPF